MNVGTESALDQRPRRPAWRRAAGIAGLALPWLLIVIALWRDRPYFLDLLSHFLPHAAAGLLILAALPALMRRWAGTINLVLASAALMACTRLWVSAPVWALPPEPGHIRLKVVHYNAYGENSRHDNDFNRWLRDQDADLIAIIDPVWGYMQDQPWLATKYPHRVEREPGMDWPVLLLSRHPAEATPLVEHSEKTQFSFVARRSLLVTLENGARVLFTTMHPASPRRPRDLGKALGEVGIDGPLLRNWSEKHGIPVIVTGDFNSTPAGRVHRTFAALSGLRGWTPLFTGGTWPSKLPPWISLSIDRVFTSRELTVRSMSMSPRFRSDHRAVVEEIDVPPPPASAVPQAPE